MADDQRSALGSVPWRLVFGDVAIIAVVLSTGMAFHGGNPAMVPRQTVLTVLPFVIGWLVGGPVAGAYRSGIGWSVGRTLFSVSAGWLIGAIVGSGLRASPLFPGGAPIVFVGVTFATVAVPLMAWRTAIVLVNRRRAPVR